MEERLEAPNLLDLLVSYKRVKVITFVCSFIQNLDSSLLLVMLVASNLNCARYQSWFVDICAPAYLAFQVVVPILLGFITDLTQDYSLEVMRLCSFFYVVTDAMLYFLPYNYPDNIVFASPYFVLVCFMARQAGIMQVGNCISKILKMRLDRVNTDEETQIAIFNHVGIFADGSARVLLILTFLFLWASINVFDMALGFWWSEGILFSVSFAVDILAAAFSLSIGPNYFQPFPTTQPVDLPADLAPTVERLSTDSARATHDTASHSLSEKWSEESSLLTSTEGDAPSHLNIQGDTMPKTYLTTLNEQASAMNVRSPQAEQEPPTPLTTWEYLRESVIVIATYRGGLLRDVNLHLILSVSITGFISIVLQFDIIPVQKGADFRNGFCGGQLMGIFIYQIVSHAIYLFGAITYQTIFVMMRPHHFYSRVYVLLSVVLLIALSTKYFVSNAFVVSLLFSVTGLIGYWAEAYDSFLAYAISPADYVGIIGVLPNTGNSVAGLLIILYSLGGFADWITITLLNGIAVLVAIFSLAISFFHRDALFAIEENEIKNKMEANEEPSCFSRYILGYR